MTTLNELECRRLEEIAEVLTRLVDFGREQLSILEAAAAGTNDPEDDARQAVDYIAQMAAELGEACAEFGKPAPQPSLRIVE